MAKILGLNCRSYHNATGDATTPVWRERNTVTSVSVDGSRATADISSRGGGGYRQKASTLAEGTVSFDLIYDDDAVQRDFFDALDAAYRNGTTVDMWFANGDLGEGGTIDSDGDVTATAVASDGIRGFRAAFTVSNFSESQELEDANRYSVTLDVSGNSPFPGYYEKTGGASPAYSLVS